MHQLKTRWQLLAPTYNMREHEREHDDISMPTGHEACKTSLPLFSLWLGPDCQVQMRAGQKHTSARVSEWAWTLDSRSCVACDTASAVTACMTHMCVGSQHHTLCFKATPSASMLVGATKTPRKVSECRTPKWPQWRQGSWCTAACQSRVTVCPVKHVL